MLTGGALVSTFDSVNLATGDHDPHYQFCTLISEVIKFAR
jgi:hypothetical protein